MTAPETQAIPFWRPLPSLPRPTSIVDRVAAALWTAVGAVLLAIVTYPAGAWLLSVAS